MRRFDPTLAAVAAAVLAPLGLAGCGPGLVGDTFVGDCLLFDRGADPVELPVRLTFVRDIGGELLGEGRYGWEGNEFKGEVDGELVGDDVTAELAGVSGGYTVTMFIEAEWDGEDEIEGACTFFESEGDLEVER
jgi:hypothetical protein